jgi:hypothetical protein
MLNEYDEIKYLLSKSRMMVEQSSMEVEGGETDIKPEEKRREYVVSGGKIVTHGYDNNSLELTDMEKSTYQETMDEFIEQVSDMVDFNALHIYESNIEWSGKLIKFDVEFFYTLGENNGVYLNGKMFKVDDEFNEMSDRLRSYYNIFSSKWAKVIGNRKRTEDADA